MAHAEASPAAAPFELSPARSIAGTASAILLAVLFLVAGIWKLTDPLSAAARMVQALLPPGLGLATAVGFGVAETVSGVFLLVPRFRRWGALLCIAMLVAFMLYMGVNYNALQGEECNCFPWIKRAVGPAFFIGDAVMLLFAWAAYAWSRPSEGLRNALVIAGAITVFAAVLLGATLARQSGIKAPDQITLANGESQPLAYGRVFLYFFDPNCSHCDQAARAMAKYAWRSDVKLVGIATGEQRWGPAFLKDTGLKAALSNEDKPLRAIFAYTDAPYGVALENGRQVQAFPFFDREEPQAGLKKLGFID